MSMMTGTADQKDSYCFICFNDEETPAEFSSLSSSLSPENELLTLTCRHTSCRLCLTHWMGKFRYSEPTCPFCRASFVDSDKMQILQMDEDTYRYMNQNTCICPSCGCRVGNPGNPGYGEEECSWSDNAMCLCGFDFNLYEMKIDGMEPVRDRYGQVNFRYTIRRREVRERRHETRNECFAREHLNVEWLFLRSGSDIRAMNQLFDRNRRRHFPESQLSYDYCDFGMKELELPVTWLFLRRGADIRAMHQVLNMNRIRSTRDYYHRTNWEPQLHAAWLFLRRGVDVRAMHHLGMQDDDDVEEIRWNRRRRHWEELERRQKERECWLLRCQEEWCMQEMKRQQEELERMIRFAHTTESARRNFLVYQQQQQEWKQRTNMGTWRCVVRREREEMRKEHREQNDPNLSWLFLRMGLDVQAMKQLIVRDDIRKIRQDWRLEVELEYELQNVQSCCECPLLDIWENDAMHFLQENENVEECMPMKWMWNRGQPVKSTRGRGRKSFKRSIIPRTKESAAKPIVRWKRRKDNLSWSQC